MGFNACEGILESSNLLAFVGSFSRLFSVSCLIDAFGLINCLRLISSRLIDPTAFCIRNLLNYLLLCS